MKWNRLLYLALTVIGVLGIIDTIALLIFFDVSVNIGVILPGLVGLLLAFYSLAKLFNILSFKIQNSIVQRVAQGLLALWLLSFIFIECEIINAQRPDRDNRAEYVLILGAGLKGDRLSPALESRMKLAFEYLKSNPSSKVIVSGGQGPGEDITEADAMRRYLVERGINEGRIIKEDKSTSTMENLRLSKSIISGNTTSAEILIITSDYHVFRAKMLAKRAGILPYVIYAKTPYYMLPNSYLREYFALIKSYFLDR